MTETSNSPQAVQTTEDDAPRVYDRASLTYSDTFANPILRRLISGMEWMTGKLKVIRRGASF